MTAVELASYVGRTGGWTIPTGDAFKVRVRVVNAREIFGRVELRVSPLEGSGEAWTTVQNVELDK